jgi:hypothetical protein
VHLSAPPSASGDRREPKLSSLTTTKRPASFRGAILTAVFAPDGVCSAIDTSVLEPTTTRSLWPARRAPATLQVPAMSLRRNTHPDTLLLRSRWKRTNQQRIASPVERCPQAENREVLSYRAEAQRSLKEMRARSFNFFRPYLIWLTGSVSKCRGRRSSCRCCSYHLYYSSSLGSGLNHASSSPSAKAILSAMIREVFVVYIDLAGTALLRLAESAGPMVGGWRMRVTRAPRYSLGLTRRVPSLTRTAADYS